MTERACLQSVFAAHWPRYSATHALSPRQWQVSHHLLRCRTAAMGGQRLACNQCAATHLHYHSCRGRHCPKCQHRASQHWCERQRANVLPVTYYHVVFTLPHELNGWVEVHPREVYALLFESVWSTMRAFGADAKRLNGQLGMSAVLHTWGQNLSRHVHLHCLVPGGALAPSGQRNPARSTYLFPVRALSRHVRGGFVSRVRHFGFLANRCRVQRLLTIRKAIAEQQQRVCDAPLAPAPPQPRFDGLACGRGRTGWMHIVFHLRPRLEPGGTHH